MDEEPASELGLEPGGLGGHRPARVRDRDEIADGDGAEGERRPALSRPDASLQLGRPADPAHEVDPPIRPEVPDPEDGAQDAVGEELVVEGADGVIVAQAPYGEDAECLMVVDVELSRRRVTGTSIAEMLRRKGYDGP